MGVSSPQIGYENTTLGLQTKHDVALLNTKFTGKRQVYVKYENSIEKIIVTPNTTTEELEALLLSICGINSSQKGDISITLWSGGKQQYLGNLLENTENTPLTIKISDESDSLAAAISSLKMNIAKLDMDKQTLDGTVYASSLTQKTFRNFKFDEQTLEELRTPRFNNWEFSENELVYLIIEMYRDFGLLEQFKISNQLIFNFVNKVREHYQNNPFHNFKHAFCVTQMGYAILCQSGIIAEMTHLERIMLLTACLGHDTDHPGYNNAYQINAKTDLAIIYNDQAPLENHHCAMLFAILGLPECNILSELSSEDFTVVRKGIIRCILATDMAKHGELLGAFTKIIPTFSLTDNEHRLHLFSTVIKCADISTEVRPPPVADVWVNRLLEEFFCQSDREKQEGLPTLPFMDRDKVTKPGAQIGFISFVVIPLYESLAKLYPQIEKDFLTPIRTSLAYYKSIDVKPNA